VLQGKACRLLFCCSTLSDQMCQENSIPTLHSMGLPIAAIDVASGNYKTNN
jgi:hypothetical protein